MQHFEYLSRVQYGKLWFLVESEGYPINLYAHLLATPLVIIHLLRLWSAEVGRWTGTTLNYKQSCISQENFAFAPSALLWDYLDSAHLSSTCLSLWWYIIKYITKDSSRLMIIMKVRIALSIFVMEPCFSACWLSHESIHYNPS